MDEWQPSYTIKNRDGKELLTLSSGKKGFKLFRNYNFVETKILKEQDEAQDMFLVDAVRVVDQTRKKANGKNWNSELIFCDEQNNNSLHFQTKEAKTGTFKIKIIYVEEDIINWHKTYSWDWSRNFGNLEQSECLFIMSIFKYITEL